MSPACIADRVAPRWRALACCLGLATGLAPGAHAEPTPPALSAEAAVSASRAVIGQPIGEHLLLDPEGRIVRLSAFRGKPLLVSFVYTGCFQVCPTSTRSLRQAVRGLERRFDTAQFNVVSIGFNQPADSPQAMKAYAAQYGIDDPHWSFLSPPAADVDALTRAFGFRYQATAAGFDHVVQVTLVDPQGRVAQQVYGSELSADALGEPLTLMLANAPLPLRSSFAGIIDRLRVLCTVYDPATGSYRVDYSLALEVAGGLTFAVAMLIYFLNEWRQRRAVRRPRPA